MSLQFSVMVALGVLVAVASAGRNYSVVMVGGGLEDDNAEVWDTIISLGGGKGVARFGVISAASEDPCCGADSSFYYYNDLLLSYGAAEVYYIDVTVDTAANNADPAVVAKVRTLTGFFIGGGDQTRIVRSFYNLDDKAASPVLIAIKETLLATGGVVAGTSAGSDVMTGSVMITGGSSYGGLRDGARVLWQAVPSADESVLGGYAAGGVAVTSLGLVDTHFENRGRQGRLLRLLADTAGYPAGSLYAVGVDENTALVVTQTGNTTKTGRVIGQRGVMLFDISDASSSTDAAGYWQISGARLSHLTRGDSLDLSSYTITPAAYKTPLAGAEHAAAPTTSDDVFEEGTFEFNRVATSLFDSRGNSTVGLTAAAAHQLPRFAVTMERAGGSAGFEGTDPDTGLYSISYSNMKVGVHAAL
jgi:cyanophycinase